MNNQYLEAFQQALCPDGAVKKVDKVPEAYFSMEELIKASGVSENTIRKRIKGEEIKVESKKYKIYDPASRRWIPRTYYKLLE